MPRSGALSVGWQQRVEILKALYREARILVLDEPTAVLTPQETEEIFAVLRRLAAEGHSIIFISHKLYEVLEIADRITVIRRGKVVGSRLPAETNEEDLAELMVGRDVQLVGRPRRVAPGRAVLVVDGPARSTTTAATRPSTASASRSAPARSSGIAGVAGNGQDELVEALTGLRKPTSGAGHARRPGRHRASARARCSERACRSSRATATASGSCSASRSRTTWS